MPSIYTLISSGNVVAEPYIDLRQFRPVAFQLGVVDSGHLAFRGSFDPTSALFTRLVSNSGDLTYAVQAGSKSVAAPEQLSAFPFLKLEMVMNPGSWQTSPRTLVALVAPR